MFVPVVSCVVTPFVVADQTVVKFAGGENRYANGFAIGFVAEATKPEA